MGLAVSVGVLACDDPDPEGIQWLRRDSERVNRVLAANGLPSHVEPECLPDFPYRGQVPSFPYVWVGYLWRAVAYARQAPQQFRPLADGENPVTDPKVDTELFVSLNSHLICHSPTEGYYVPINFPDPLYDDGLPGGVLGSSQRVLQELVQTAPMLGIPLVDGNLSDDAAKSITNEAHDSPYWIERQVWFTMFEAFRHSIEYKCAVVFG